MGPDIPKKKKVLRYKKVKLPDKVVNEGSPTKVEMSAKRGDYKREYVPYSVVSGDKKYGPEGDESKSTPLQKKLTEARSEKKISVMHNDKNYAAGFVKPGPEAKISTKLNVNPRLALPQSKEVPVYERTPTKKPGNLKPMSVTLGGSDRKGDPANKFGLGQTKRVRIRKVKSNPRGNHR